MGKAVLIIVGVVALCLILFLISTFMRKYRMAEMSGIGIFEDRSMKSFLKKLNSYDNYRMYPISSMSDGLSIEAGYICLGNDADHVGIMMLMKTEHEIGGTTLITTKIKARREISFKPDRFTFAINKDGFWIDFKRHVVPKDTYIPCFTWLNARSNDVIVAGNVVYSSSSSGCSSSIVNIPSVSCTYCYQGDDNGSILLFNDKSNSKYLIYVMADCMGQNSLISESVRLNGDEFTLQYSKSDKKFAKINSTGVYADGTGNYYGVISGGEYDLLNVKGNMICISYEEQE